MTRLRKTAGGSSAGFHGVSRFLASKRVRFKCNRARSCRHRSARSGQVRACPCQMPEILPTGALPLISSFWTTTLAWLYRSLKAKTPGASLSPPHAPRHCSNSWQLLASIAPSSDGEAQSQGSMARVAGYGRDAVHGALRIDHVALRNTQVGLYFTLRRSWMSCAAKRSIITARVTSG